MAGRARLSSGGPGWRRLVLLALAVLLAHALAVEWLAREMQYSTVLKPTVDPMFTRLLQPHKPAAVPVAAAPQPAPDTRDKGAFAARVTPPKPAASQPRARERKAVPKPPPQAQEPALPQAIAQAPPEPPPQPQPAQADASAAEPVQPPAPATSQAQASAAASAASSPAPAASAAQAAASAPSPADTWPPDTRLSYRLSGQFRSGELYGDARVQWQRDGSAYQVRVAVDVTVWAKLVLTSQGEITPAGLMPRAYEETRNGKSRGLRLDQTTVLLDKGVLPRPDGVQDTASQFVELAHRFATGRAPLAVGQSVSFWMARPGGLDVWTYDVVERETLQLPRLGATETFHLVPRPIANPRGNITAQMWFAPSLQYLPVRIRVTMGDAAYVDLLADRIEQR